MNIGDRVERVGIVGEKCKALREDLITPVGPEDKSIPPCPETYGHTLPHFNQSACEIHGEPCVPQTGHSERHRVLDG